MDRPSFAFRFGSPLFVLAALTFYGCAAGFNNDEVLQDSLSITDGASHDFGNSTIGKNADKTLTIQNKSRFDITLLDLTPEKAKFSDDFKITGGTCTQTSVLTTGSDCSLSLTFNPKSKGEVTGVLPIGFHDDFNSATLTLNLRGYAKTPGILTLSELGTYDFGERGLLSETTHVFTLSNSGEAPITFRTLSTESLSLLAPFKRAASGATCATGSTLAVSNTCLLPIVFAPSQSGEVRQVLNIPYYNDSITTALSLAIRGKAGSVSLLSLSEISPFNFGDVSIGSSSTQVFTLTQLEGVSATLGEVSSGALSLSGPFRYLGGTCSTGLQLTPASVLGDSSGTATLSSACTLSIAFTPTQANLEMQTLQLKYDDGISTSTLSRDLRGTGISPPSLVAVPAGTYDYGTRTVGTTTSKSFQLVNQGQASTTLGTITGASIGSNNPFSLSGGTCTTGTTLGPLTGSCTLIIDYVPTTASLSTQDLRVSYLTGTSTATSSLVSFGVKGTGQVLAELSISDASHYTFGSNSVGSVSTRVFTLTNSSTVAAVLGNVATSGNVNLSAPYSRSGGTCANGQTLAAAGGNCTLEISYSPTAGGVSTTQLSISYHNGTSQTYLLQGLGGVGVGRAAIAISPSGYDHGNQVISTSSTSVFTLSNTGGSTATFGSLADAGLGLSAPFSKTGGSCTSSGTLTSGSSCTLTLAFTPVAATSSTSTFTVAFSDQGGALSSSATISGTGINGAALSYSDSPSFDFGSITVDLTSVRTFTITNSGTTNGTLGTISTNDLGLSAPFSLTGGSCTSSSTITQGGGNCTLEVTASPTSAGNSATQISLAYHNGGGMTSALLPITVRGLSHSVLSLTPLATFDFGNVPIGGSSSQTFTITNQGQTSATLGTVNTASLNLTAPFSHTGGTCSSSGTVAPSATCTLTIQYSPVAQTGSQAIVSLAYTDQGGGARPSATHALQGTGVNPASLAITPSGSFNFGSVTVGNTSTQAFTITNSGSTSATLGTIDTAGLGLAAPFTFSSGTCATSGTVAAASSCVITLSFTPSAAVNSNVSLSVAYNDGVAAQSTTKDLGGLGISPATLAISDGPTYDYGSKVLTTTTSKIFTVNNTGATAAALGTLNSANLNLSAPFSFNSTTCGASIAAGGNCTVTADFTPSAATTSTALLSLAYNDGVAATYSSRDLKGTGLSRATLSSAPVSPFNFGNVTVGTTSTQVFTITNSGEATATLSTVSQGAFALAGTDYAFTGGQCSTGGSVAGSAACTLTLSYAPSTAGASTRTLTLDYSDAAGARPALSHSLQGTGISVASLTLTPSDAFDFGSKSIGSTSTQIFTLTNSGATAATLGTIDTAGLGLAAPFSHNASSSTCLSSGSVSGSGGTCLIAIDYAPSAAVTSSATLSVSFNNGASTQTTLKAIQGTGISAASLAITPSGSFNFGSVTVGNTSTQAFTITNSGSTSATLGTIDTAGLGLAAPFTFSSGTCATSGTVAAASSCVITLSFAPSAAVNSNVSLSVAYNDGVAAQSTTKDLGGLGITPATLAITPSGSFNFGGVTVGNTSTQAFTITNSGSTSATLGTIDTAGLGLAAPFTFSSGTCATSGTVAAASSCVITLSFAPSAAVNSNVSLSVAYNDGVAAQSTTKDLGGLGISPATLAISDGPTYDYGSKVLTTTTSKIFTVNNTGATAAALGTLNSANLNLSAPFSFNSTTCGASIAAGGNCTVTADFTPSAATTSTVLLSLAYNDGVAATYSSRDLKGTGISQAALALTPSGSFNFGSKTLTTATTQTFTLTNSGQATATLGTISTAGLNLSAPFTHTGGNCNTAGTLAASASCTIAIDFTPSSATNSNAVLSVAFSDEASTKSTTKDLGGLGLARALLAIAPGPTFDFGSRTVATTTTLALTVTNSGASTATLGTVSTAGLGLNGSDFAFHSGTCASSGTLSPASTCVITASFSPGTTGAKSKTLTLDYSDAGGSLTAANTALEGTGLTAATLAITPAGVHDFGEVGIGNTSSQTFTVSNTGQSSATLTDISNDGLLLSATPFTLASSTCSTNDTLTGGGGNCTVTVEFAPTSTISSTVTFSIGYNNGLAQTAAGATVQGTGINLGTPALTLSPRAYHFGSVLAGGNSSIRTFTFTNSGDGVASGCSAPTITGGDGKLVITQDGCGTASLAASSSCTVSLQVQSPVLGSNYSATLTRECTATSIQTIEDGLRFKGTQSIAVRDIATGYYHTCVTLMDGTMKCWGYNSEGQLGYGDGIARGGSGGSMASLNTLSLGSGVRAVEIAAGYYHTCAILDTGDAKCWGRNTHGQLGQDNTTSYGSSVSETPSALNAINIGTDRKARSIAAGQTNTCAIRDDGELKCWGDYPALGFTGDSSPKGDAASEMSSLAVVTLDDNGTIHKALSVGVGKDNACAATDRGKLFCWGTNASGEAGQDTSSANFTPSILPNIGFYTRATKVKVNENFACAVDEISALTCWGSCVGYELGNGCPTNTTVGVNSGEMSTINGPMFSNVRDLRLGYQTGCGLSYNGKLSCWGSSHHVLGNGVAAAAESATDVSLGSHRVRNFDLYREHACAVFGDGGLRCWGKDQFGDGMLGRDNGLSYGANSTTELATMTPVNLGVKIGPIDVGMSTYHTCAVLNDGSLKCWGYGSWGGLGLGDSVTRGNQPWDMETLPEVNLGAGNYAASVSHGLQHTCVTLVTGEVKCFGTSGDGRLGQSHDDSIGSTSANEVATLTAVNTSGTFLRQLQVGDYHNCGVTESGYAYCWGNNTYGQLGLDDTTHRGTSIDPMAWWMVTDGSGSVYNSITAGYMHTCGATIGGQVFCWGHSASGQTGHDSTTDFGSGSGGLSVASAGGPLPLTGVTKLVAGNSHSCALDSSGQVKCWGDNSYGQLGNGSWNSMGNGVGDSINSVTAVNLGAGLRAIDIAAGAWHTCAILGDRSVKCWGYNNDGELGYDDTTTRGTPTTPVSGQPTVNFGAGKKALKIFAGPSALGTCVITTDGELKCWGLNDYGQLGQGSTLNWGSGASGSSLSNMPPVPLR